MSLACTGSEPGRWRRAGVCAGVQHAEAGLRRAAERVCHSLFHPLSAEQGGPRLPRMPACQPRARQACWLGDQRGLLSAQRPAQGDLTACIRRWPQTAATPSSIASRLCARPRSMAARAPLPSPRPPSTCTPTPSTTRRPAHTSGLGTSSATSCRSPSGASPLLRRLHGVLGARSGPSHRPASGTPPRLRPLRVQAPAPAAELCQVGPALP